jgi:hypothetical protein
LLRPWCGASIHYGLSEGSEEMAIRFRRSIKIAPGVRLNLGKKSASVRIGGTNAGYTVGTKGRTASASIPGTGLGVTSRSGGGRDLNWLSVLAWLGSFAVMLLGLGWIVTLFAGG